MSPEQPVQGGPEVTELRRQVRAAKGEYRVVKNTLAKRALAGTPFAVLDEHFTGTTAVAYAGEDPLDRADDCDHNASAGYADVVRPYTPGPGVYTYWDYTQLRFPRKEGMRIDFVLASPGLARRVTGASIDRQERKGKGASDHAPIVVDLT